MTITVKHIHSWADENHPHHHSEELINLLSNIQKQNHKIMGLLEETQGKLSDLSQQVTDLNLKADTLQGTIDAEQADIKTLLETNAQVVSDLNAQIATLQGVIATGATAEQLQGVLDGISAVATNVAAVSDKITAASDDVAGTV